MKRIWILLTVLMMMCIMAVCASATTIYKDESGTVLFECEIADTYHIASYEIKNGGFAKVDGDGDALTWYLVSTATEDKNVIKTVASAKTKNVYSNGKYTGFKLYDVVSANFEKNETTVPSFGGYSSQSREILFLYVPDGVTTAPDRICQRTPAIVCEFSPNSLLTGYGLLPFYEAKSLRSIFIPAGVTTFPMKDGKPFQNCTRLTTVEFAKNSVMTTMQGYVFATCNAVKSLTLPDSVTTVHGRAFQGMKGLEYANLGANVKYLTKPDSGEQHFSLFYECANLKTVVISGTLLPENVDANGWGLQMGFPSGTPTIIYTGTLENLLAIQAKFKKSSDNGAFTGATVENGRLVIADHCETFFGGHAFSDEDIVGVTSYLEKITVSSACEQCKKAVEKESINPIFTWIGYSACTYGEGLSVTQGYRVDQASVQAYLTYAPDFDFGALAAVNKEGAVMAPKIGDVGVLTGSLLKTANDYLDVKITGIPAGHENTLIIFCLYVTVGEEIYYIDNEACSNTVSGVCYNDVLKING